MMRFLIPIILTATAIGVFGAYVDPQYQEVKTLSAQVGQYDDALNKAKDLRSERDTLLSKRNTFAQSDLDRLQHALPDNVDNIRLIIDINNVASRHSLSLSSISVGAVSDASKSRSSLAVGSSGDPVGSVSVDFTVSADYDSFLAFLHDIEHSLRIIDVESITFSASQSSGKSDYSVSIRTYWLH